MRERTRRLQSLAAELASAEHRERKRLASLLHDDLQQLLAAASFHLTHVRRELVGEQVEGELQQVLELIGQAQTAGRQLIHELRPPALYEDGRRRVRRWPGRH